MTRNSSKDGTAQALEPTNWRLIADTSQLYDLGQMMTSLPEASAFSSIKWV